MYVINTIFNSQCMECLPCREDQPVILPCINLQQEQQINWLSDGSQFPSFTQKSRLKDSTRS